MPTSDSTTVRTEQTDDDMELPVEEVAERLGLPVGMLVRRIEAGDIPARRIDADEGVRYRVRIADLGASTRNVLPRRERAEPEEPRNGTAHTAAPADDTAPEVPRNGTAHTDTAAASPQRPLREPGAAVIGGPSARNRRIAQLEPRDDSDVVRAPRVAELPDLDEADIAEALPPPPARGAVELAPLDAATEGPRSELQAMALDPRELVAGLLDRWERTLEQRIYAEQRQRFEAELTNRQAKVKQLQLELDAVRAEHAAALAEKERVIAEKIRELSDRERDLDDARHAPRRSWFFRR